MANKSPLNEDAPICPPMDGEIIIPLPNGNIVCGPGHEHQWGGYLRLLDTEDREILYYDIQEWKDEPEEVIGAFFCAAQQNLCE